MFIKLVQERQFVEGRINAFHTKMFHGVGRRIGVADWEACDHQPGDDLSNPIQYTCNAYRTPDLAKPSLNFMASAEAHAALQGLPGLSFASVSWQRSFTFLISRVISRTSIATDSVVTRAAAVTTLYFVDGPIARNSIRRSHRDLTSYAATPTGLLRAIPKLCKSSSPTHVGRTLRWPLRFPIG